mmetsp:Transcript_27860/g.83059  ORF Transcript_27860/g.83059 Transcript_27860/m.83059 type:complete len:330 (+) Transcript_27860:908-1897(+)
MGLLLQPLAHLDHAQARPNIGLAEPPDLPVALPGPPDLVVVVVVEPLELALLRRGDPERVGVHVLLDLPQGPVSLGVLVSNRDVELRALPGGRVTLPVAEAAQHSFVVLLRQVEGLATSSSAALLLFLLLALLLLALVAAVGVAVVGRWGRPSQGLVEASNLLGAFPRRVVERVGPGQGAQARHAPLAELAVQPQASRRVPGAQETQHLDAQVEDLALGGPRVRPRALALLTVEVEAVVLLVRVLGPLGDLPVNVLLHLLHLQLQVLQLPAPLLGVHVGVAEVDDGLVGLPIDVLQGVRPRADAGGGVVVEDAVVAVEVLGPVGRQGGL